ncbi:MAG: XdhC family protein [Candidatus Bathyarchaeia archaeon]
MIEISRKIVEMLEKGETIAVTTIIRTEGSTPRGVGAKMIVTKDGSTYGTIGGDCLEREVVREAFLALKEGRTRIASFTLTEESKGGIGMVCGGKVEVLIECIQPKPTLLIVGSGHVAKPLAKWGRTVGFSVTVVDPLASQEDFPDADHVITTEIDTGLSQVTITPNTYVAIVTGHEDTEQALRKVIDSEAAYLGMISSKRRAKITFKALMKDGVPAERLRQVRAPIGLDIGAETPEEIAVSIIAEIIKTRRRAQR